MMQGRGAFSDCARPSSWLMSRGVNRLSAGGDAWLLRRGQHDMTQERNAVGDAAGAITNKRQSSG